jgi:hypothetical protein
MGEEPRNERRYPRHSVNLDATVYVRLFSIPARITNLSQGGCLIYPPLGSALSTEVKLLFRLPDGSRIACKGEIVYEVFDRGTGVAFTEISQYNQEQIAEFFERQHA